MEVRFTFHSAPGHTVRKRRPALRERGRSLGSLRGESHSQVPDSHAPAPRSRIGARRIETSSRPNQHRSVRHARPQHFSRTAVRQAQSLTESGTSRSMRQIAAIMRQRSQSRITGIGDRPPSRETPTRRLIGVMELGEQSGENTDRSFERRGNAGSCGPPLQAEAASRGPRSPTSRRASSSDVHGAARGKRKKPSRSRLGAPVSCRAAQLVQRERNTRRAVRFVSAEDREVNRRLRREGPGLTRQRRGGVEMRTFRRIIERSCIYVSVRMTTCVHCGPIKIKPSLSSHPF